MISVVKLIEHEYDNRLGRLGIPADPTQRTPDQAQTAAMLFGVLRFAAAFDASTLTQADADGE